MVLLFVPSAQVNENDMVISLPSSLTGVVRRREVSDYFHLKAVSSGANRQQNRPGSKGRYFEEDHEGDSPLSDLFREGQASNSFARFDDGRLRS